MRDILKFFLEIGKLKDVARKGITFYGVKDPDSSTDHTFRSAVMAWVFGKMAGNLDVEKLIKLTLIHDIYKIYLGDATPYAGLLPKAQKDIFQVASRWRRLDLNKKQQRYNKKYGAQYKVFRKLFANLPSDLRKEAVDLQQDYTRRLSRESKFIAQIDLLEDLLEALEQHKKNKKFPTRPWWEHADEMVESPVLLKFLKKVADEELRRK